MIGKRKTEQANPITVSEDTLPWRRGSWGFNTYGCSCLKWISVLEWLQQEITQGNDIFLGVPLKQHWSEKTPLPPRSLSISQIILGWNSRIVHNLMIWDFPPFPDVIYNTARNPGIALPNRTMQLLGIALPYSLSGSWILTYLSDHLLSEQPRKHMQALKFEKL